MLHMDISTKMNNEISSRLCRQKQVFKAKARFPDPNRVP